MTSHASLARERNIRNFDRASDGPYIYAPSPQSRTAWLTKIEGHLRRHYRTKTETSFYFFENQKTFIPLCKEIFSGSSSFVTSQVERDRLQHVWALRNEIHREDIDGSGFYIHAVAVDPAAKVVRISSPLRRGQFVLDLIGEWHSFYKFNSDFSRLTEVSSRYCYHQKSAVPAQGASLDCRTKFICSF